MKNTFPGRLAVAVILLGLFNFIAAAQARPRSLKRPMPIPQTEEVPSPTGQGFVVQDLFGGEIFGYGVDESGTEGLLSEALLEPGGNYTIATETFDQTTGRIIALVEVQLATQNNFVTLGVVGSHIGLREDEHVQGLYVVQRTYNVLNPLAGNRFTGAWLPPINNETQLFEDVEGNQGTPDVAVMASTDACCGRFVFGSNVAANLFGPIITLQDPILTQGVPPLLGYDSTTNQAVLSQAEGAPNTVPVVDLVNLTTRNITEFTGLGHGFVNGLAVDSGTGIACTTTESYLFPYQAEFYNLATQTGFVVDLPNIGEYAGATVANDPVNKLFLITHPVPAAPGVILVYDENGNLIESLTGFPMGPGGATIALNPNTRTGFVLAAGRNGNLSGLQSFTY